MPFFYYQNKMLCYLWIHKKYKQVYIGFADGAKMEYVGLISEKRSKMKIFLVDAAKDLPFDCIGELLQMSIDLCKEKWKFTQE